MLMKRSVLVLAVLFLIGCAHGERVKTIRTGMSKSNVIGIMGQPEGVKVQENREVLSYYNKLIGGWTWDRADYHVVLQDDKVIEYGAGEIRQNQRTGALFIYNMR